MTANTIRWLGGATAVAQVDTLTLSGTLENTDIFKMTLTGENQQTKLLSVTAGTTVLSAAASAIAIAWNASTDSMFASVTALKSAKTVRLTADTAGVPFYLTVSATEANGDPADAQQFVRSATTANAGPYDFNTATNWSSGAIPGTLSSSTVYIESGTVKYGLNQTGAAQDLAALYVTASQIGENGTGGNPHSYLRIHAPEININYTFGPGTVSFSSPINIDADTVQTAITVYNSGTNSTTTEPSIRLLGTHASNTLTSYKGSIGVANSTGEVATFATITTSYIANQATDVAMYIGSGCTLTTIVKDGGTMTLRSALTTITQYAGTLTTDGSGAIATANIYGGTAYPNATGTIAAMNIENATVDFTRSRAARTVTTLKMDPASTLKYDPSIVTLTNKVQPISTSGNITIKAE